MNYRTPVLGLRANWAQFWLLVLVNAFVGAMVGLERTVLPLLAEAEFGLTSHTAGLSFIAAFGAAKAATNLLAGRLGDRYGRKRILVAGWLFAIPVPLLVIWAPTWTWVLAANVLLGIQQGLTWSTTVLMKIDLVGPQRRGLAMGLNEFAGYLAVAMAAFASGAVAERFGMRPAPFYAGLAIAALGLALSLLLVRDTLGHVRHEAAGRDSGGSERSAGFGELFRRVSWSDRALGSASQVGLVNNLNDGLVWGLLPVFFAAAGLSVREIGWLAFAYPATWGVMQVWTGSISDRWGRKPLIVSGMLLQGIALIGMVAGRGMALWVAAAVVLGIGTAMVYPTLLAAVGDVAHPSWRGSAVGLYRFWRDAGYVAGALVAGLLADAAGMSSAIAAVGCLTIVSGLAAAVRMPETLTVSSAPRRSIRAS